MKRGALLVLEGCDRAGKSTQVKMLVQALNEHGISAESRSFPARTTCIGELISRFLLGKKDISLEAVHLLFSANRWECSNEIIRTLQAGTTLVIDRYAASGAAYTAATTGRDLSWCKDPDRGLPCPDLVALLEVSESVQRLRDNWGNERFEHTDIQRKVASNYHKLLDETWVIVDGNQSKEDVHSTLLEEALKIVEKVKDCPIKKLYQS